VICLTDKPAEAESIGPLVTLRAQAVRHERTGGVLGCRVEVIKDKRRGRAWSHEEVRRGPLGLR
jgi:hypothetical protein